MGLDLLDAPIRLSWDFPGETVGLTDTPLPAIARSIVEGGVFFVTLQGTPLRHPSVAEVFEVLGDGCQLLFTCHGHSEELVRLAQLPTTGAQLLLETSGFMGEDQALDSARLLSAVEALRRLHYEPVLSMTPLRNNLRNIPDLIRFCSKYQIVKFKLPNANISGSFHDYSPMELPRWQDLDSFRQTWLEFTREACPSPAMEIHDLFLWEIMTPGQKQNRSEYGGCQAGNSLGHLDAQGTVHPCAAWPEPLGRLPDQSLEEIWAGTKRLAIREQISKTPTGCHDCTDLSLCFGGCRGLAFHLNRNMGARDLMCSGPR